jgi:NAD(P)-dependent dehydrogenase (short-subunit alcohol dehydrogenase family)
MRLRWRRVGLAELTILVTGAGSGIGRSTAELAAAAGATVVCADVKGSF